MATVINNPNDTGSGAGTIVGLVVAVIVIALIFIYGLPALRGTTTANNGTPTTSSTDVNVSLPGGTTGSMNTGTTGSGTGSGSGSTTQ